VRTGNETVLRRKDEPCNGPLRYPFINFWAFGYSSVTATWRRASSPCPKPFRLMVGPLYHHADLLTLGTLDFPPIVPRCPFFINGAKMKTQLKTALLLTTIYAAMASEMSRGDFSGSNFRDDKPMYTPKRQKIKGYKKSQKRKR